MTHPDILRKAIERAIKNGYLLPDEFNGWTAAQIAQWIFEMNVWQRYIYDSHFAELLWPDEPTYDTDTDFSGNPIRRESPWKRHLKQIVIADDPIKCLGENI